MPLKAWQQEHVFQSHICENECGWYSPIVGSRNDAFLNGGLRSLRKTVCSAHHQYGSNHEKCIMLRCTPGIEVWHYREGEIDRIHLNTACGFLNEKALLAELLGSITRLPIVLVQKIAEFTVSKNQFLS